MTLLLPPPPQLHQRLESEEGALETRPSTRTDAISGILLARIRMTVCWAAVVGKEEEEEEGGGSWQAKPAEGATRSERRP